jgi:outer membrane protein assembly factor BamB
MEGDTGFGFEEFSVEMGDFEIKKTKQFDRMWRTGAGGSIASELVLYNNIIYFGCADQFVYAVNPDNGELVWRFKTEGPIVEGSVTLHDGVLYIGSFDKNMYALRADTGQLLWKFRTQGKVASTPAINEGILYFGSKDQNVYALDARTGKLRWKYKTFDCIISEPAFVGDKLIIGSYDRFLYCLDKRTGMLEWKHETQGEIHNPNAFTIKDGIVYVQSFDDHIRAIDVETGRLVWKVKLGQYGSAAAPVIRDGVIYYPSRNGVLYATDMKGRLKWKFVTKEVIGIPCLHDDKIYVGSCDFCMHCLDLEGHELWRFKTNGYVWYKTIMIGNRLYFPSWDCFLYCLDTETKQVVWKFKTVGNPCPLPPPYEAFELELNMPKPLLEDGRKKTYELDMASEDDGDSKFYKSRITYQISTQYAAKGKYQIDSDEEAF